jgi:hypothetical protein
MNAFEKIDRVLHAQGWTYDIGREHFLDNSGKVIHIDGWLVALVPGITPNQLVSCTEVVQTATGTNRESDYC